MCLVSCACDRLGPANWPGQAHSDLVRSRGVMVSQLKTVFCLLMVGALVNCGRAYAKDGTFFYLNSGVGLSPVRQYYGEGSMGSVRSVRLPSASLAMEGGLLRKLAPSISGILDLGYYRFGEGESMDGWADLIPTVEPSTVLTSMVGLKFEVNNLDGPDPFLTSSVGLGHVMVGDMNVDYLGGKPSARIPGARMTALAFAIGAGLRMGASTSGVRPSVGFRWVRVLTSDEVTNIVPIVIGLAF